MALHRTATIACGAGAVAAVASVLAPEPWDIAAVVFACMCAGISCASYTAAHGGRPH